jgi:hypothetical protein
MKDKLLRFFIAILCICSLESGYSQVENEIQLQVNSSPDSLEKADVIFNSIIQKSEISLSREQAISFLQKRIQPQLWIDSDDPLRLALDQLIYEASHQKYDSAALFLGRYQQDSLQYSYQGDSIQAAVNLLTKYLEVRDSSFVNLIVNNNSVIPVWINTRSPGMTRYWLKNDLGDSVAIWIGNPAKNTIGLYLEQGVSFRRTGRQGNYSDARIDVKSPDNSRLLMTQKIVVKPQYWKFRTEAAFVFSQSALTNWVKGGENSISSLLDITGYADYSYKPLQISSSNFGRIKLGFQKSGDDPVRKNVDIIETNSKFNHKAFGKFDFSAIMLFKTQLSPGYSYAKVNNKDTSVLVSKMFNPVILTVGLGLDFKPNKKTSINFSPFSYKGTYVTDTINIDQTKYGIPPNKKSLNEPGASFMISNEFKPTKNITLTNRLQLFTNYIHNPMNIDVDWEVIGVVNLNWFTDIRFNTHLIFDDDTKTAEMDDNKQPIKLPDGTVKKTARIQFKEMLGISLVFRF